MAIIVDNRSAEVFDLNLKHVLTPNLVFDKHYNRGVPSIMAVFGKLGNKELVYKWKANSGKCFKILASTLNWDEMQIIMSAGFAHTMNWTAGKALPNSLYAVSAELDPAEYYLRAEEPEPVLMSAPKVVGTSFCMMNSFDSSSNEDKEIVKLMDLNRLRDIRGPLSALLPLLEGISTPIFHVGLAGSAVGLHIKEGLLPSINLLMSGKSTWIFIDPRDNQNLLDLVRADERRSRTSTDRINCRFLLTHKHRFIPLWKLRQHRIRYNLVHQTAGDVVFVYAGIYHQVFNSTDSIKMEVSTTSLDWYDMFADPKEYSNSSRVCKCSYVFRSGDIIKLKNAVRLATSNY